MKSQNCLSIVAQRENIIAKACSDLASDLRKIDPATYVLFFHTTNMPEIFAWINETFERHFPGNEMSFACTGQYLSNWHEPPVIAVDMEFEIPEVFAFFRLYFAEKGVAVELHHISFEDISREPSQNTRLLERSLEKSRHNAGL